MSETERFLMSIGFGVLGTALVAVAGWAWRLAGQLAENRAAALAAKSAAAEARKDALNAANEARMIAEASAAKALADLELRTAREQSALELRISKEYTSVDHTQDVEKRLTIVVTDLKEALDRTAEQIRVSVSDIVQMFQAHIIEEAKNGHGGGR